MGQLPGRCLYPLKPHHSCNSGDNCNCQNNKSFFAVYLHRSLDEHAVTECAYARIICMYELLAVLKMKDPTDV